MKITKLFRQPCHWLLLLVAVVLVGDNLVYGGNPYRQSERLGPRLAAALRKCAKA